MHSCLFAGGTAHTLKSGFSPFSRSGLGDPIVINPASLRCEQFDTTWWATSSTSVGNIPLLPIHISYNKNMFTDVSAKHRCWWKFGGKSRITRAKIINAFLRCLLSSPLVLTCKKIRSGSARAADAHALSSVVAFLALSTVSTTNRLGIAIYLEQKIRHWLGQGNYMC